MGKGTKAESIRLKAESNRIGYCRIFFERPLPKSKAASLIRRKAES